MCKQPRMVGKKYRSFMTYTEEPGAWLWFRIQHSKNPKVTSESWQAHKRTLCRFNVGWQLCIKTDDEGSLSIFKALLKGSAQLSCFLGLSFELKFIGWEMPLDWLTDLCKYARSLTKMGSKSLFVDLLILWGESNCQTEQNVLRGSLFLVEEVGVLFTELE